MQEKNRFQTWLSNYVKPLSPERRREIIDNIRTASSPGFDYFFLVILSSSIATLGLINDSPAVIIGAMLVAPLMSPILGVGLGSITADTNLARNALSALIRGALLAIILSALLTLSNIYLPFVPSLLEIPNEILNRTQPTPNDLVIALAGGLAAAYSMAQPHLSAALPGVAIATALMPPLATIGIGIALGRWDIAGGAALLFLTNAITIAFAATLVFSLEGFVPSLKRTNGKFPKPLIIAGVLTTVLLIPLTILGARLVSQAHENRIINNIIETEISEIFDAEMINLEITRAEQEIQLEFTIRSNQPLNHNDVISIQETLVSQLGKPIALIVNHIKSETLDPLVPPTQTATRTLGPSPTRTFTPTQTITETAMPTSTATNTPTSTIIPPTSTPITVFISRTGTPPYYYLYQQPGGEIITQLSNSSSLLVLNETMLYEGLVWVKIKNEEGDIGWYPKMYLQYPEPAISPTATNSN